MLNLLLGAENCKANQFNAVGMNWLALLML
mgnify:FL=1|jgi:hypothetical protein